MVCKQCGAKYDKNLICCPYCHSENAAAAKEQKEKILKYYDDEEKRLHREAKRRSEQAPGKITKFTAKTLFLLLAGLVLLTVLGVIGARVFSNLEYKTELRHKEKLEAMLSDKDYEGIETYLNKKDLYGHAYEKYNQVSRIYRYFLFFENDLSYMERYADDELSVNDELLYKWAESAINDARNVYIAMITYTQDNAIMDNESYIKEIYGQCAIKMFSFGFTEEEITSLMDADENLRSEYEEKMVSYYLQK